MPVDNIWDNDEFSQASLTDSINKQPRVEGRLARHFRQKSIRTTSAVIEEKQGLLSLIQSSDRGTEPNILGKPKVKRRIFTIPHLQLNGQLLAKDLQDALAFGSEDQLKSVAEETDEILEGLAQDHENTWEFHRAGAIQGLVKDADGSTIHNYFDEFSVTEQVITFTPAVAKSWVLKSADLSRKMDDALGQTAWTGITAYCGPTFWDALISDNEFEEAWLRWRDGERLRDDPRMKFSLWGINWEEYRTKVGTNYFLPVDVARFVPEGADLFRHYSAPADTMDEVNKKGKPMYVRSEPMKGDKGRWFQSQSNPLFIPLRPGGLFKGVLA